MFCNTLANECLDFLCKMHIYLINLVFVWFTAENFFIEPCQIIFRNVMFVVQLEFFINALLVELLTEFHVIFGIKS